MAHTKIETQLAQIGNGSCDKTGAVNPPIYLSTAYAHQHLGHSTGYDYARVGNPTRELLEATIAQLEGGVQGFATSSGMAAVDIVLRQFAPEDELIVSRDLYGGTYRLLETMVKKNRITAHYVDTSLTEEILAQINSQTKAIFVETPTNPLMIESDIKAIAKIAKDHDLQLIVDNTFYTPLLQQPLKEGADIVIHSATKYLGGHNDVLAGLIVTKTEELAEEIGAIHKSAGAVLSAFDSWLLMRGMKTLALRLREQEKNAKEIVTFLKQHPFVSHVYYPGKGGMLSFKIKNEQAVNTFLKHLNHITFAESLGGTESFITYPATQTHADVPIEVRTAVGVCNCLLRFSVGIEHIDDLKADLCQALTFGEDAPYE